MSRTATAGELAVLARKERTVGHRVKVQNGSGTMVDYSVWLDSGKIERDVDQPVDGCTLSFVRSKANQSLIQSLSPLRTDSVINRLDNGTTYSPALDLNRIVTVEIPTTAIGSPVLETDYKLLFKGTIDVVSFEKNPVVVTCRDLGAPLVDRWIETETTFGTGVPGSGTGGRSIQLVMQDILDAVFGASVYPLYTPVSPSSDLNTYKQQRMSVMDALQDLAQQIGWDVRYRWDDGTSAFRLTLSEPPRAKTTPDYTFGPSAYHDITELSLDKDSIRNAIEGNFRNANNLGNRESVIVTDATSISKYGRLYFYIQEADISPIDSSSEMTTMLNSALADLKEPKANQSVNMPLHWPADLWDLYRYSPNSVHYDSNQDIAVVELTHEFAPNYHRTTATVRGTPIGQYTTWRGRGSGPIGTGVNGQAFPPYPFIAPRSTEANDSTWDLRFNSLLGSGGGGTNLTYTIKSKKEFGAETTLASGNASAFPRDLTITRDLKQGQEITFAVTDAATGMFASAGFTVPFFTPLISATGTISSQQYTNQVSAGNRSSAQSSDPLTATDAGATATVSIAAHGTVYGFGTVSYNSGSITGLAFSTKYYIYADDPTFAGGSVTYSWTQDVWGVVGNSGRYFVGSITTPADGAGGTGGGGGGGCVADDMWLSPGLRADAAVRGDSVDLWIGNSETDQGHIYFAMPSRSRNCVELTSESGARLVLAFDTRVTLKNGTELIVLHMQKDDALPVLHPDGRVVWERVHVKPVGLRQVVPLNVANGTFAAGDSPTGPRIFTHNLKVI